MAIEPSARAIKTLLPRLVMSRMESFMIQDHSSHCDWWLKAKSLKSRVPTRTSPEWKCIDVGFLGSLGGRGGVETVSCQN